VTVLDSSGAIDYLLGTSAAGRVAEMLVDRGPLCAPDLLVFEVLAVLRRHAGRGELTESRALGAVHDLGDLPVVLFPAMPLRGRAFELRANLTVADAIFVALAETLGEPLATKDRRLAAAATEHARVDVVLLED